MGVDSDDSEVEAELKKCYECLKMVNDDWKLCNCYNIICDECMVVCSNDACKYIERHCVKCIYNCDLCACWLCKECSNECYYCDIIAE